MTLDDQLRRLLGADELSHVLELGQDPLLELSASPVKEHIRVHDEPGEEKIAFIATLKRAVGSSRTSLLTVKRPMELPWFDSMMVIIPIKIRI
jgi:hypothetical protein